MKPIAFKGMNATLRRPSGMTDEECSPLHVWRDDNYVISKWKGSFAERLKFMLSGYLWLWVMTKSKTQPPVAITTTSPLSISKEDQ